MNDFEKAMASHEFDYVGYCGMKKRMVRWTLDCKNCVKSSAVNVDMNFTAMIGLERECFNKEHVRDYLLENMGHDERKSIFTVLQPGCSFTRFKSVEVEVGTEEESRKVIRASKETEIKMTELVKTMVFVGKRQTSTGKSYHCKKCGSELSPWIFKVDAASNTICPECGAEITKPKIKRHFVRRLLKFLGLKK